MKTIKIGPHKIGIGEAPFIIAEMSGNHNQSLETALAILDAAAEAGAHAIKLQTYTPETITIRGACTICDPDSPWNGRELYDLYTEAYTPWEWHKPLFERAIDRGLIPFSSPFDETAVDLLEDLQAPLYKIASFENTHHPLLRRVAQTRKPVIMSTGVCSVADLDESVRVLRDAGCEDLILLKCTSTYPSSPANSNLRTIPHLGDLFRCVVGLSDHTLGIGVAVAAVALGARVIEKHFTLSRSAGGVDAAFSLEPYELKALVAETNRAFQGLGEIQYGVQPAEQASAFYKRSIYVARDIKEGEIFTKDNLAVIRPAAGLHPRFYSLLIGKRARRAYKRGEPLTDELHGPAT